MDPAKPSLARTVFLLFAPFLLLAIAAPAVGEQVDRGAATPGAFGLLIIVSNLLLAPLGNHLEAMVFGIAQRPWLGGRLRPWQRLILPYSTARALTLGITAGFGGGAYLLGAPPGGSVLNILAVFICISGGALLGFALSRLVAGMLIIRYSGLWAASGRAWMTAGAFVVIGSIASAAHSISMAMHCSSVL